MLSILGSGVRLCDQLTRREMLRVGGLGFTGLAWSSWLQSRAAAASRKRSAPKSARFGQAKACILVFSYGGPSHLDTLDLKPNAPPEIRGEFHPIATQTPGLSICEHLPRLAKVSNHYTLIRSVTHRDNDHAIGAYLALTGYSHPKNAILGIEPPATPQDLPSLGSVVSKLRPASQSLFSYITLGDLRHFGNNDSLGQNAGCLGKAYDPFTIPFVRPINGEIDLDGSTKVMGTADTSRMSGRQSLLAQFNRIAPELEATSSSRAVDGYTRRAFELLSSSACRRAFDLSREPPNVRDFYGASPFARSCLLARRLVEAEVPLVTVYSFGNRDWDTHAQNFSTLKNTLLPPTDQGLSALLVDLADRGMLDETLVVWMSDMGRTPRINRDAGRDHWSFCYSILMAGGGVRGGQVYGSSDRAAAHPSTNPVSPADVAATIYHCLGIDSRDYVTDQQGRPLVISSGTPIQAIL
jgi:Protein of unknown function (DUF1501)